jgi:hypothetical protein
MALQRFAVDKADRLAIDVVWVKLPVDEEALLLIGRMLFLLCYLLILLVDDMGSSL